MMTPNKRRILLLTLGTLGILGQLTLNGCDLLTSSETKPQIPEPQTGFTDQELLELAYSSYKFPDDFYQEELNGGSIYYVNTVSVLPVNEREHIWIELCTEDRDQAFAWSESSSRNSAYYRELVSESESEKYYEFRRVYTERPTDILLSRAHKCSYIDRSSVDRFLHSDTLGIFRQRPITRATVKELAEYLHFTDTYNISNYKILSSNTVEGGATVRQEIYQLNILFGDWGMCDDISLSKVIYTVDKQTGLIVISRENIRGIRGECH